MAQYIKLESAKQGATASARRVLSAVTAATAAPTAPSDGVMLQGTEQCHLVFQVSGAGAAFYLQPWVYDHTSRSWNRHSLALPAIRHNQRSYFNLEGGPVQFYLQVVMVSGTTPQLNAWIEQVVDTP